MKTLKKDWLVWLIILAPIVLIGLRWSDFPNQIPTHFGIDGKPDDYSNKAFGLFLLPGINLLMYFLFLILPKIDPSGKNYKLFSDKFKSIRIVLHVFFTFMFFLIAFYSLGYHFNLSIIIIYSVLVLILFMGNYMRSVRHNYFIGVRTPWTLANEEIWTKTHRLTSTVWVFSSLIAMITIPFIQDPETVLMPFLSIIIIVPIIYSYLLFKKTQKN